MNAHIKRPTQEPTLHPHDLGHCMGYVPALNPKKITLLSGCFLLAHLPTPPPQPEVERTGSVSQSNQEKSVSKNGTNKLSGCGGAGWEMGMGKKLEAVVCGD